MIKHIFPILLFFALCSCSQYYKFDELYDKGEFLKAYHLLDNINDKNSIHYQRRLFRVVIKLSLDGDRDFMDLLRSMVKGSPVEDVNSYYLFGLTYLNFLDARDTPQYQSVISNLQDLQKVPEEFKVYGYKLRGISLYKLGNYNEAINDLNSSYKILPFIDDLYFIGKCYYGLQDYKTSYDYFNRVSSGTQDLFFRGLANFEMGEIDFYETNYLEALSKYIESVNFYSRNAVCTYKIAKCLEKLKYNRLSPEFYKTSLRITNDYASAWFFLNIN